MIGTAHGLLVGFYFLNFSHVLSDTAWSEHLSFSHKGRSVGEIQVHSKHVLFLIPESVSKSSIFETSEPE